MSPAPLAPRRLRKVAREPLVHFALGGGLIFLLYQVSRGPVPASDATDLDPAATSDRTITVEAADLQALGASFRQAWKREPNPAEVADLLDTFLREEILFREGESLRLGKDDPVVRRRVIEKMALLAGPQARDPEPSDQGLRRWFTLFRHRFFRPERIWFEHAFFDPKRHADVQAAARKALEKAGAGSAPPAGDPFVLPAVFEEKTRAEVAHLFGEDFAKGLWVAKEGLWNGPISSQFGQHLVRPSRRAPAGKPAFDEVRAHVRADWLTAENRGLRAAADTLLGRYRIHIADRLAPEVLEQPLLDPFLRPGSGSRAESGANP